MMHTRLPLPARSRGAPPRGAALLVAMVILTLVATLAAGMVWQQWRSIQVETAERARMQAAWILDGALDWAELILREDFKADQRNGKLVDNLGEPWAVPLAETRLSSFLAGNKPDAAPMDGGLDAFLSGQITDAQSRYNLFNLINAKGEIDPDQLAILQQLCTLANVSSGDANRIADAMQAMRNKDDAASPLTPPPGLADFTWMGLDSADIDRLSTYVTSLPVATLVNANTAPREVLAAVLGVAVPVADHLVQARQQKPIQTPAELANQVPGVPADLLQKRVSLNTQFFEVEGQVRLGDRILQERSLVWRRGTALQVLHREWISHVASSS